MTQRSSKIGTSILGASAFVLAALTIIQAGKPPAFAETANSGGFGYSVATIRSGQGPNERPYELVYVVDSRGETLFIYYIENSTGQRMQLRQALSLPALFRQARGG
ncbi:MAG: hypothetical protein FJ253_00025 [Phycisphaerae bacterium]|nr:hypothetical protein [Phycisphaerae bacterium]